MSSESGTAAEITVAQPAANIEINPTPVATAETAVEAAAVDEKKALQDDVHPVVKSLWADFTGTLEEFKTWLETEAKKIL